MDRNKAEKLATLLDGEVLPDGVAVVRADGRYVVINEDAGACYFDDVAATRGYSTNGSDPRGEVDAEEWGAWDGSERWARALASLIGGRAHQNGGNIWVVYFEREDGRLALIGDESGAIFTSEVAMEDEQDTTEYLEWV